MAYPEQYKLEILYYAKEHGTVKAAEVHGITPQSIILWNKKYKVYHIQKKQAYSIKQKIEILEYAKCHTNQETENKFGVAPNIFRKWNEELKIYEPKKASYRPRQKRFSIADKRKILEHAKKHGITKAAKAYNVATKMIAQWNDVYHVYQPRQMRTFTEDFKREVVEHAQYHPVAVTAIKYNVPITSVRNWMAKVR